MHLPSSRCASLYEACLPCTIRQLSTSLTSPQTRWAPWNLALSDSASLHWANTRHSFGWNWMHPRHQVHFNFLGSTALVAAHLILQGFLPLFPNKLFYHPGYYIKWRTAWFLYALLKLQMQKNQHMKKKMYQNNPKHPLFLRHPLKSGTCQAGTLDLQAGKKPTEHTSPCTAATSWWHAASWNCSGQEQGLEESPCQMWVSQKSLRWEALGGRWQGWWNARQTLCVTSSLPTPT